MLGKRAATLSGGQRQMLAFGRALMSDPKLLILDEPSAGLAPKVQDEVFAVIKDINGLGVSILMVEQRARQCLAIADYGYVLEQGRNRLEGPARDMLVNPEVVRLFSARYKEQFLASRWVFFFFFLMLLLLLLLLLLVADSSCSSSQHHGAAGSTLRWKTEGLERCDADVTSSRTSRNDLWRRRVLLPTCCFRGRGIIIIADKNSSGGMDRRHHRALRLRHRARISVTRRRACWSRATSQRQAGNRNDGPRGPAQVAQPRRDLAREGRPAIPCFPFHLEASRRWTLGSWSRTPRFRSRSRPSRSSSASRRRAARRGGAILLRLISLLRLPPGA